MLWYRDIRTNLCFYLLLIRSLYISSLHISNKQDLGRIWWHLSLYISVSNKANIENRYCVSLIFLCYQHYSAPCLVKFIPGIRGPRRHLLSLFWNIININIQDLKLSKKWCVLLAQCLRKMNSRQNNFIYNYLLIIFPQIFKRSWNFYFIQINKYILYYW